MKKELKKRILSSLIIVPISLFFIFKGSFFFIFFLTMLLLISLSEWLKMNKKIEPKILGLLFLIFSFYSTYMIRNKDLDYFLLIIIICISTDLGGYIFGKLFKGPKLIKISPNKTYSGMIGSFLIAIFTSYLFTSKYVQSEIVSLTENGGLQFIIFVLIISSISQIGDLIISYFKRLEKIKDTGKILPGHGGIFDRIDGLMFVLILTAIFHKLNIVP